MTFRPRSLLALLAFWILAASLQWRAQAYRTEFGDYHDEPAHYVTGLMVRDYVASMARVAPMAYAQDYYLHYPKVAFGHWPPAFYVAQAVWTLPFGASRASVMLLLALLAALLALLVYREVAKEFGALAGLAAGALLITLPLVQEFTRAVMSDLLHALLAFGAAVALGRYLDEPHWKRSVMFGLLAAATILNKGTGLALAVLPAVCLLLTLRFGLLLRPSFWLSALVVAAVAGPWYLLAPNAMHQSAVPLQFVVAGPEWTPRFRVDWLARTGWVLVPFALIGLFAKVLVPLFTRQRVSGTWAAAAGLAVSVIGFRILSPVTADARHALPAVPALVLFAAAGLGWLLSRAGMPGAPWKAPVVGAALVAFAATNVVGMPPKRSHGFSELAADLLSRDDLSESVLLVSGDALGEGMLVAEIAMREKRPGHVVLRASKVLSESGWMGEGYSSLFDTPEQLMEYLDGVPVGVLVMDGSEATPQAHHRLLREVVARFADRWERVDSATGAASRSGREIEVWRLRGHEAHAGGEVDVELTRKLRRMVLGTH
ncbi:MAG: ArnT family glycosyltransferase [Candidatus Eiseniibacteriota bacterium]